MAIKRTHAAGGVWAVRGQSTVELALTIPAMVIAALIAYNALMFFGDCATFDRVFRDAVRVYASSESAGSAGAAGAGGATGAISAAVATQLDGQCEVSVTKGQTGAGLVKYIGVLGYRPTVFGRPLAGQVFGVSLPPLIHTCTLVIDTFRVGQEKQ